MIDGKRGTGRPPERTDMEEGGGHRDRLPARVRCHAAAAAARLDGADEARVAHARQ